MTCDTLRISVLNTSTSPPPALGLLTVTVRESGGLRNWPPASAPSTHAYNGTLTGALCAQPLHATHSRFGRIDWIMRALPGMSSRLLRKHAPRELLASSILTA